MKVGDLVRRPRTRHDLSGSVVYSIPCGGCSKHYIGESGRGLAKRISEHRADMRFHRTHNAMVLHADAENHLPRWKDAVVLHQGVSRTRRRALEAAEISTRPHTNVKPGFFRLSRVTSQMVTQTVAPNRT